MRGQHSPVFKRMTSLKAPLVIAGIGAALGALGWIANQPWFQDFIIDLLGLKPETTETKVVMQQIEEKYMESNSELKNLGQIEAGGGGLVCLISSK